MSLKSKIRKVKTLEDAEKAFNEEVRNLRTIWSEVYKAYDETFSEQIKMYEYAYGYVAVVRNFDGLTLSSLDFYFTKTQPKKPHEKFPVPHSYIQDYEKISFSKKENTIEEVDLETIIEEIKQNIKENNKSIDDK